MEGISIEKKLELIQSIRNEQQDNTEKIQKRKHILYDENSSEDAKTQQSFPIRMFVAIFLFAFFFIWDKGNFSIGGMKTEQFKIHLEQNIKIKGFDFIEKINYNLNKYMKIEVNHEPTSTFR